MKNKRLNRERERGKELNMYPVSELTVIDSGWYSSCMITVSFDPSNEEHIIVPKRNSDQ